MSAAAVTGVVLAGGRGRRLGGRDKGLARLHGRPLVEHVLERLAPQVAAVRISANRNRAAYRAYGYPVDADALPGYAGPLAGLATALARARTPWVLTAPCDVPYLPLATRQRLQRACRAQGAEAAVARAGGRRQPAVALVARRHRPDLAAYLASGGRCLGDWLDRLAPAEADLEDVAAQLANVNTPAELAALALGRGEGGT